MAMELKYYSCHWFGWFLQLSFFGVLFFMLVKIRLSYWYSIEVWNISIYYDLLMFSQFSLLFYKHVFWTTALGLSLYWGELAYLGLFENLVFVVIFSSVYMTIIIMSLYYREKLLHILTVSKNQAEADRKKTEELLVNMIPPHVYKNLREENVIVDTLNEVTLMYADIVGFTQWSSDKEPIQIVEMLSKLFDRFDYACKSFGVYKVHTIGDCYVVMGNVDNNNRNPFEECLNMVMFAQRIIEIIEEVNELFEMQLNMRIGMNTGRVIGGVTGSKIVRYDIYGPDVLIANKVESNGISGKICVSESSKNYLELCYSSLVEFGFHKEIGIPSINQCVKIYTADLIK